MVLALLLFMASLLRCLLHRNHSKTLLSVEEVAMSGGSLKLHLSHKYATQLTFGVDFTWEAPYCFYVGQLVTFHPWFRKKWKICSDLLTSCLLITAGWKSIGVSSRLQQAWEAGREYLWDSRVIFSSLEGHGSFRRPH